MNRPWYKLHPCGTSEWMKLLFLGELSMLDVIDFCNRYLWSLLPVIIILIGAIFSYKTRCVQLRLLPSSTRMVWNDIQKESSNDGISSLKATFLALAATVGTGNLSGVAGAITIGGPGAIFWMWVSGVLGMIIKFLEVFVALNFRKRNQNGEWVGGPMVNIVRGMPTKFHFMAYFYAFFGMVASFGIGNATQVNTIIGSIEFLYNFLGYDLTNIGKVIFGIVLALFFFYTVFTGTVRIGKCVEVLIPISAISYISLALIALLMNIELIPHAMRCIFVGAFQPRAVTSGMIGSFLQTLRIGISRGIFTNEAGMGTASIAHASAEVEDPVTQGLFGIFEVFIDTIVICTLTALVILCNDINIPFGNDSGIQLTFLAFSKTYNEWILIPLSMIVVMLATATIFGWGMYGGICSQFLLGNSSRGWYIGLHCAVIIFSTLGDSAIIWSLAEIANGLMAIPNLISIAYLTTPAFINRIKTYRPN